MSEYKGIKGFQVQTRDGDPPSSEAQIGDFYYNSATGTFKNTVSGSGTGTWASGANMNTARYRMQGGMGTYTAAYAVAGATPPKANVENYNGTSWTEVNDVPSARADVSAGGTATAGFALAGTPSPTTETLEWDGTNWTQVSDMNSVHKEHGFAQRSPNSATLNYGDAPSGVNTEEWNGTSWTETNNLSTGRSAGGSAGNLNNALYFGGRTTAPTGVNNTEEWSQSDFLIKTVTSS